MALLYRDTDKDWQRIGHEDPLWGVLTAPEYRTSALTPDTVERFYASGEGYVNWLNEQVQRHCGQPLRAEHALDFGCGAGRITHAMPRVAARVTGLDISPGMLTRAREKASSAIEFKQVLADERFDWLHSYIVFQHIPPTRGMVILDDLLSRLQPNGLVTLHFTTARSSHLRGKNRVARLKQWLSQRLHPAHSVSMFDYDIGKLMSSFHRHDIRQMTILSTDHGGHFGVYIIGVKGAACNAI